MMIHIFGFVTLMSDSIFFKDLGNTSFHVLIMNLSLSGLPSPRSPHTLSFFTPPPPGRSVLRRLLKQQRHLLHTRSRNPQYERIRHLLAVGELLRQPRVLIRPRIHSNRKQQCQIHSAPLLGQFTTSRQRLERPPHPIINAHNIKKIKKKIESLYALKKGG